MIKRKIHTRVVSLAAVTLGVLFLPTPFAQAETLGPNLIGNPSFTSSPTLPTGWSKGGYGTNTRTLTFPVSGQDDAYAVKVNITSYTSGDAKWYFNDVAVQGGRTYQFSDYFQSNVPSIITVRYTLSGGGYLYNDIASLNANSSYEQSRITFIVPSNAVSLTIFHLIKQVGILSTDNYSLNEVIPSSGNPNLIPNPDLEIAGSSGKPAYWNTGSWGGNTPSFTYPVSGVSGSSAAGVTITGYTSGDAKWYFAPLALSPGVYAYADQYTSTIASMMTAQFQRTDGSFFYIDLGTFPSSGSFREAAVTFSVPENIRSVTIFHLIKAAGTLTIDNASLQLKSSPSGIFTTGAVSLTFDDGGISQYQNAVPKLNSVGTKGTFYIVTQTLADYGYSESMSTAQIADLYNTGHEIAAHTRTHAHLPTLSAAQQQDEIDGSRQDLFAMDVGPIQSFAYPFGEYDDAVKAVTQAVGFTNARGTISSYVGPTSDRFALPSKGVEITTTVADVTSWIDAVIANKEWLILRFHDIDTSGSKYSATPDTFNQIIDYLTFKNVPVVTIEEGMNDIP